VLILVEYSVNRRHWNDARNWVSPGNALHNIPICMSKKVMKKNNDEEGWYNVPTHPSYPIS
jgi:hypothetical protein